MGETTPPPLPRQKGQHMSARGKLAKGAAATIAVVALVSLVIGEQETADVVPVAADKAGWATGATAGGVKYFGPGVQRGFAQMGEPTGATP
jgi:hypothetical protein